MSASDPGRKKPRFLLWLNNSGEKPSTKLYRAIAGGDLTAVRDRLSKSRAKQEILTPNQSEQLPLVSACYLNNTPIVAELLKFYTTHRLDINLQDKQGYSVLHHAVQVSDEQIVSQLLRIPGINVRLQNLDMNTPLHYFCEKFRSPKCDEVFAKFLEMGADVNAVNRFGETPLHKLLLEAGADINTCNGNGEGPLHFAVRLNRDDLVSLLIMEGADIHGKGKDAKTPYEIAVAAKQTTIATRLHKVSELYTWLQSIDPDIFRLYRKKFLSENVYLESAIHLDAAVLDAMGIDKPGHKILILGKVEKLKAEKLAAQQMEPTSPPDTPKRIASVCFSSKTGLLLSRMSTAALITPSTASAPPVSPIDCIIERNDFEFTGSVGKSKELVGSGTSGKVYRALYKGNEVAVKVLKEWEDEAEVEEFRKEFEIMCVLHHPNIVTFIGACIEPNLCIIMEYCSRGNLFDVLSKPRYDINWDRVFKFSIEMVQGMHFLHTFTPEILHRDFKSLNVLVTSSWDCKICDFGLSRFNTTSNQMATLREMRGTFPYCAPELATDIDRPVSTYTTKSDVYSIGITFWEVIKRCVEGVYSRPWYSEFHFPSNMDFMILIEAQKGSRPTLPHSRLDAPEVGTCPVEIEQLYRDCVHGDPALRPDTGTLIARLLELKAMYESQRDIWALFRKTT
ncbi:serine/threonineprotein kinase [Pelomyxa schiedti]|nr:serine/threonineprotein kinase [Pelomyxa schiedti]